MPASERRPLSGLRFLATPTWLGVPLLLALGGCPGDDGNGDAGDDANATGSAATGTGSGSGATTNAPTSDATDAMTSAMSGSGGTDSPPTECEPPCGAGEVCVDGTCEAGGDSTGQPAECGTTFTTRDRACDQCWQDHCCEPLQLCHGDETITEPTACTQVDACIAENCTKAMTLMDLQTCVDESCPELSGEVNTWYGLTLCTFNACDEICNPPKG